MLVDPTKPVVARTPAAPARLPAARTAAVASSFGNDTFTSTRRQTFVTMSDGHSALNQMPKVATLVKAVRQEDPRTLVLYGGDAIIGTPYYPAGNNGVADMQAIDKLGVASFVIGNHDLDGGYDNFVRIASQTNLPFVVANWEITGPLADLQRQVTDPYSGKAVLGADGKPLMEKAVQPYRVFTNPDTGLKTVVIGLSIDPKDYGCLDPRITYQDPAATLDRLLPQIEADPALKGALITVQTHLPASDAEKLEARYGDKVFFAAHDHMPIALPVETTVNGELSAVTDTGGNYRSPGIYHADVGDGGKLVDFEGGLVQLDNTVPADPDMIQQLAPVQKIVDAQYNTPITNLTAPISRSKLPDMGDSPMGDWVADNMKAAADKYLAAHGQPPTDLALLNATGMRTDFRNPGPLTAGDVYRVFPFDNSITVVTLTADQLQQAMDNSAKRAGDPISGVTAELSANGAKNVMVNGKPLGAQSTYRVATLDFMADKGGSGYDVLTKAADKLPTGISMRDMLTNVLKSSPTLTPPAQVSRLPFVDPKPLVGPPPPPPSAATDSFVGTWQQRVVHYLGKDESTSVTKEIKMVAERGLLHL